MRIAELTAFHVRIPLKTTIRHASHVRSANDTLIVRCRLDDGTAGWGEGLPRSYVTGETIDSALEQFRGSNLADQLREPFSTLREAIELCEGLRLADQGVESPEPGARSQEAGGRGQGSGVRSQESRVRSQEIEDRPQDHSPLTTHHSPLGNSLRCAIELSVLDAACRAEGVPLSRVTELSPHAAGIRERRERVRYGAVITTAGPWATTVKALKMRLYAFRDCKVKVGAGGDDAARLARVRRILGRRVELRLDANEAWRCAELPERLAPLLPYGILCVEQPVPHAEIDSLAPLRGRLGVPVMLDESLCSVGDARRAIERGTCEMFNIRLSKCGGYLNSLKIAGLAHRAGLGYQLGCMVGETGILSAAGRHFACSVGGIRWLEGSYDRHLVTEPLTVQDVTFRRGGLAPALTGPGLGIDVDEPAVERATVSRIVVN